MNPSFPIAFGKYILLKPLAQGGMGEIFLALAGEMGGFEKLCVIKRVRATGDNDHLMRRFQDEGKVVVKLSHGNLVQVFDVGQVGDEVYLAMEYVEGRDLRDMMVRCDETRTRIPTEVALYITMQVLRGLQYAHNYASLKLVHRDVCPSNVLVSYFGEVKLTDFGLAQSVLKQELTEPGKVYGRFSYLSPEQARREEVDHRTDIHATGIILWELLVGRPMRPGPHSDPATALSLIRTGRITTPSARNPRITPELDNIVVRALASQRNERYANAEEMRSALAKVQARHAPGFDAGGVAGFMRELYDGAIDLAREEREHLLAQDYSRVKGRQAFRSGRALSGPVVGEAGAEDLTGQVVDGRYQVIRLLGEGGMGAVYEAEHMEIGRRVAVKILHAAFSTHPETVARFRQEARAATRIGHPNIVEVTDSGTTVDGRVFFVMELLSGIDLAQVMSETRLVPVRRALRITLQVCKALHAAHEEAIVHRDLKPENVFLIEREGKGDFVKVLDFGIAKNVELAKRGDSRLTHPGMAMGTPEYMAPEQASGEDIDRRIDVYATGAMLYEMLTGHLPHEGENLMQMLSRKASQPVVPPKQYRPEMPEELQGVILKSIAFDRNERYATMEELARDLYPFAAAGATEWGEQDTGPLPGIWGMRQSGEGVEIAPTDHKPKKAKDDSIVTDPTVPLSGGFIEHTPGGSVPAAHVVSPGQVRMSDEVVPLARSAVPMPSGSEADIGQLVTAPMRALPEPRRGRWLLLAVGLLVLGLAGVAGAIWWPQEGGEPAADAGVDAAVVPDAAPRPDARPRVRRKLTPQEADLKVEWARRAAAGRRFLKPRGDNVKDLLAEVERDFPGHPKAAALRKQIIKRVRREIKRARRKKQVEQADRLLRVWIGLAPGARAPHNQLAALHVAQGRRALGRRQYAEASKHARVARRALPDSGWILEFSGDVEMRRKRAARAVKHYEEALKVKRLGRAQKRRLQKKLRKAKRLAR